MLFILLPATGKIRIYICLQACRGQRKHPVKIQWEKRKALRRGDYLLLAVALLMAVAASLRGFGIEGMKVPVVILLAGAVLLAVTPLLRLAGSRNFPGGNIKKVIMVIFAVHLAGTLFFFPPEDLINSRPVITLDHAVHFYQVERAVRVFPESFRLNAYDPYFMAGYPGGAIFDIDSKGVELWCAALQFMNTARAYKIFILLGHLLMVFTIYAGCRRLGFREDEAVYSLLLFLVMWHWGRPYLGAFRYAGMFAYLTVCHLSLYIAGLFRSFARGEQVRRFFLLGPLTFFLHPSAVVLLPVPFITTLLAERRVILSEEGKPPVRLAAELLVWCLLVIAVNAIWLVPLLGYLNIKTASESFFQIGGLIQLFRLLIRPGNLPTLLILILSATGLARLIREKRFRTALPAAAGAGFLFLAAAYGVYIPLIDQMEPGRFVVPALIFAIPLSGPGVKTIIEKSANFLSAWRMERQLKLAVFILPLIIALTAALISARKFYRHTLSTEHTPEVREMVQTLVKHTDPSGRLMFQDGLPVKYGHCYLASLIPLYTGVEQIGGPYPHVFIRHSFTNFHTRNTMGSPLAGIDFPTMNRYLKLYHVRWILTASKESHKYFQQFPGLKFLWSNGEFALWETFPRHRDITTRSGYDYIRVSIRSPGDIPRRILLPYHWDPALRVKPPAQIKPHKCMDDPIPFILLEPEDQGEIEIRAP